jgi:hypothetical protein
VKKSPSSGRKKGGKMGKNDKPAREAWTRHYLSYRKKKDPVKEKASGNRG